METMVSELSSGAGFFLTDKEMSDITFNTYKVFRAVDPHTFFADPDPAA